MRLIIRFAGLHTPAPLLETPSLALQELAGSTVIGHILTEVKDMLADEVILLTGGDGPRIAAWIQGWDAGLAVRVIETAETAALGACLMALEPVLDARPVLLIQGNLITQANYPAVANAGAAIVAVAAPAQEPGALYFRQGTDMLRAVEGAPAAATPAELLGGHGREHTSQQATLSFDAGTVPGLLAANARLLTLGRGSEDAIERSYVEDFTVIPPVYLHESAEIENAVLGPFVHVGAGAAVRSSVLRNTIVNAGGQVRQVVLDGALVGEGARLHGRARASVVPAGATLQHDGVEHQKTGQADE